MSNQDGSQPTSLAQCWERCAVQFGTSLVSADFWPNSLTNNDARLCWCQTACTSITQDDQSDEHPAHLAIAPDSIPASSGLGECLAYAAANVTANAGGLKSDAAAIAGGIIGGLAVVGLMGLVGLTVHKERKKALRCQRATSPTGMQMSSTASVGSVVANEPLQAGPVVVAQAVFVGTVDASTTSAPATSGCTT